MISRVFSCFLLFIVATWALCPKKIYLPEGIAEIDPCLHRTPAITILIPIIQPDDFIIEVGSDLGYNLLGYANFLGEGGIIVGCETISERFSLLVQTVQDNGYFDKSLVLNIPIAYSIRDVVPHNPLLKAFCESNIDHIEACKSFKTSSLTSIYDLVGNKCPSIIVMNIPFVLNGTSPVDVLNLLLSGTRMIKNCNPTIYIDHLEPVAARSLIIALQKLNYENIYWDVAWNYFENYEEIEDLLRIGLIILGNKHNNETTREHLKHLIPYINGLYSITEVNHFQFFCIDLIIFEF